MQGDFSRDTSKPARVARYTRALLQQGRLLLDADFNEQSAIHHDFLRTLIVDLMGRGWRPGPEQFLIDKFEARTGFSISKGHFYVDGILCENPDLCWLGNQPFLVDPDVPGESFIAYIECWERHLSAVQRPELREIALGGPDTASRAQIVWQVRAATAAWADSQMSQVNAALDARIKDVTGTGTNEEATLKTLKGGSLASLTKAFKEMIATKTGSSKLDDASYKWFDALTSVPPRLRAMAKRDTSDNEACSIAPEAIYRGRENQLYRVEIHDPGTLADNNPTFKWSRENGSVLFAVRATIGEASNNNILTLSIPLETLGRDRRTGVCVDDRVEVTSDDFELEGLAPPLGQITQIDRTRRTVTVEMHDAKVSFSKCTALRRWDQTVNLNPKGTVTVKEGTWIPLERGVQLQFQPGGVYRTGDYWLIPARVASGDVIWPQNSGGPAFIEPDGIARHRAAIGQAIKDGNTWTLSSAGRIHVLGAI